MAIRLAAIICRDIKGNDAFAHVDVVDRDNLDRDAGQVATITVKLNAAQKQAMQGIFDTAKNRYQARIDKATTDKQADPNAPVDLSKPLPNEDQ